MKILREIAEDIRKVSDDLRGGMPPEKAAAILDCMRETIRKVADKPGGANYDRSQDI